MYDEFSPGPPPTVIVLADANRSLAEYAREAGEGTVIVTRHGKPVAAVVSVAGLDLESLMVSGNPTFIEIVEQARASVRGEGGIPLADMKRRFSSPAATVRKAPSRTARRSSRKP